MNLSLLKKLCLALALLMSGVAAMGQSMDKSVEIMFRQGSSIYDPNFSDNSERLQKFSEEIVSLHAHKYEIIGKRPQLPQG